MEIKVGSRWCSAVCETEIIVVRKPNEAISLACGGVEMVLLGSEPPTSTSLDAAHAEGTQLGKRYADDALGIEVLCTKPGRGSLTVNGEALTLKVAKSLPTSD
jgi:hypothetical protein